MLINNFIIMNIISIKSITLFFIISSLLYFSSCYYDNYEEIYPKDPNTAGVCDTSNVLYTSDIKPIFDLKCKSCHSSGNSTGCNLENYNVAKSYIIAKGFKLYDKVKNNNHQNITLSDCEKLKIHRWTINPKE